MASAFASPPPPERPAIGADAQRSKGESRDEIGSGLERDAARHERACVRRAHARGEVVGEQGAQESKRGPESFGVLDLERHLKDDDGRALILYTRRARP